MAIYKQIQEYVKDEYGFQPKSCWIAHMKEACSIPVRVADNRCNPDKRKVLCPENKKDGIINTFKHFGMM